MNLVKAEMGEREASRKSSEIDGEGKRSKSPAAQAKVVRFGGSRVPIPPLGLEAEELERDTDPVVLWQVYAIGGFFILRWVWARWNERRAKKKSSNEDPSATSD